MAKPSLSPVLQHLRRLVQPRTVEPSLDAALLERFLDERDEEAFAVLVRRHGPMVLGVCRRILQDRHDAEDACQAAFFVLARQAASLRTGASLGGWLYRVAYRTALKARAAAARRRTEERGEAVMTQLDRTPSDPLAEADRRELHAVLDEELDRLPEKYRTPLVLCYLQGKSTRQAAVELGWPEGSMSKRLARGRNLLHQRLAGRGVALAAAGAVAGFGAGEAAAALPEPFVQALTHGITQSIAGPTVAVSASVASLAEGVLHAMWLAKVKTIAAVVALTLSFLALGSGVVLYQAAADKPTAAETPSGDRNPPLPAPPADVQGDPLPPGARARLGTLRWRHGGTVFFVAYAPDGKSVVSASADGTIRLWETATGKELRRFEQPNTTKAPMTVVVEGAFHSSMAGDDSCTWFTVAFSADGKLLASCGNDRRVRLWETATGKELRPIQLLEAALSKGASKLAAEEKLSLASALVFSPDGKTVASKGPDQVPHLWDMATGKELRQFGQPVPDGPSKVEIFGGLTSSLAFAPDGKLLASALVTYQDKKKMAQVRVWEAATGKEVLALPPEEVSFAALALAFTPDGKTLAWAGANNGAGGIRLYEVATGKELRQLKAPPMREILPRSLVFAPDGKTLSLGNWGEVVHLWDVATGQELRRLAVGDVPIVAVAFAPDGKTLALGKGNAICRYDVATGQELAQAEGAQGAVWSLAVAPQGKTITTVDGDGTVHLWEAATGKELRQFQVPVLMSLPLPRSLVLSGDGLTLASTDLRDQSIHLWDVATGKELRHWKEERERIAALAFAADGKVLATVGLPATIRLWDVATGKEIRHIDVALPGKEPEGDMAWLIAVLTFARDGRTVAALGLDRIRRWDVATGKEWPSILVGEARPTRDLAFSPDGRSLASLHDDGTLSLWETASGKERCRFGAPQQTAKASTPSWDERLPLPGLAFSPDGAVLAAGSRDRTIRLWDVRGRKELGQRHGHQGRVSAVAFTADGQALVSGSTDATALVWDAASLSTKPKAPTVEVSGEEAETLWADLAGADAAKAYGASRSLTAAPKQAVPLLGQRLKPVPAPDAARLARLIVDLASARFAVRQKAAQELEKLGELAEPELRKVLAGQPALETRQRIEQLLEKQVPVTELPPAILQSLRGIEVLEQIGTGEARQVLEALAQGATGARPTRDAQASLERLTKRAAISP